MATALVVALAATAAVVLAKRMSADLLAALLAGVGIGVNMAYIALTNLAIRQAMQGRDRQGRQVVTGD